MAKLRSAGYIQPTNHLLQTVDIVFGHHLVINKTKQQHNDFFSPCGPYFLIWPVSEKSLVTPVKSRQSSWFKIVSFCTHFNKKP